MSQNLQDLSTEELTKLFGEVVKRKGYSNVSILGNVVYGTKDDGTFGISSNTMFYCTNANLSGIQNVEIDKICDSISATRKAVSLDFNSVYLVSNQHLSNSVEKILKAKIEGIFFITDERLSALINDVYPEYNLLGDNLEYLEYKNVYQEQISEDAKFSKLPIEGEKYRKLLDFFISPRLSHIEEDKIHRDVVRKTHSIDDLIEMKDPILIGGGAGAGKSTLLKQIGKKLFTLKREKPILPVFVTATEIHDFDYKVKPLLQKKLESIIHEGGLHDLDGKYDVMLLVDSIDEFENHWEQILEDLQELKQKYRVQFAIGTRNTDAMLSAVPTCKMYDVNIRKFNAEQIGSFVSRFFNDKKEKAEKLLDTLRDNNIIEKLPVTPLSLSLISILYDENGYEVPATITDIYDNFNTLILGRATISDKISFIDIAFKERVLSQYALKLLEREDHIPMTREEFKAYFIDIYRQKSHTLIEGTLDDALDYLARQTGILEIDKSGYVRFTHSSYMEYYASREIFNNARGKEKDLVENFYDYNWQNAAVFYAGRTKDMYEFLQNIYERKIKPARRLPEMFSSIAGSGYLLQALYFTDNRLRCDTLKENLRITLDIADTFKKLSADDQPLFKDYKVPVINIFTFMMFYESFRSITLREPLTMAYDELYAEYQKNPKVSLAYNLLQLAFTLNSRAINYPIPFEQMVNDKLVYNDANLIIVACQVMDMVNAQKYKATKKALVAHLRDLPLSYKNLMIKSSASIRFTDLDTIIPERKITLFVEGETDARIIEHAYMVLTNGATPYWTIRPAEEGRHSSSASNVAKAIKNAPLYTNEDECYIGILDHDAAGLGAFGKELNAPDFEQTNGRLIKKHARKEVYAIVLPIPEDMQEYNKKDQVLNFFEIEHYFGNDFLVEHKAAHRHEDVNDVYKVHDGIKTAFAEQVTKITDIATFARFKELFTIIDDICNIHPTYEI